MADTMQFDLVSPERNLVSVPAREVRLLGAGGSPLHPASIPNNPSHTSSRRQPFMTIPLG